MLELGWMKLSIMKYLLLAQAGDGEIGIKRIVNKQLKAEESVKQSEKQYRSLFSVLNEGVCARAKAEIQQMRGD
jgi:hypothetical protein